MIEIFIATLLGIHSSALILKYFYSSNEEYKKLEPNRKNYFIKNLFKSYFLFVFSIVGTYYWIQGRILNNWNQETIHKLGLMYSANINNFTSFSCFNIFIFKFICIIS